MAQSDEKKEEVLRFYREFRKDEILARLSHTNSFFHSLIRSLILVNGAAIIALFTFIGNGSSTFESKYLWLAFSFFSLGIASAILATWGHGSGESKWWRLSYVELLELDQVSPGTSDWDKLKIRKSGILWRYFTIFAYCLSLTCFVFGSYFAMRGVLN